MLLIGILIGFFIPFENAFLRTACKILLLPLTVGIGFEFLMYAGKHDNPLVRILSRSRTLDAAYYDQRAGCESD